MSIIIQQLEQEQLRSDIPNFSSGDTVTVNVKVREGKRERVQAFKGIVIARRNRGLNSAFTVRKIASSGDGIERTFQTHSPLIDSIVIERYGKMRQAKPYFMRERTGRAARITEDLSKAKKAKEESKSAE